MEGFGTVLDIGRGAMAPRMRARVGAEWRGRLAGIPADASGIVVRVFAGDAAQSDHAAMLSDSGDWFAVVPGEAFAAAGDAWYEIRGEWPDGGLAALARGRLSVLPFSPATQAQEA